MPSKKRPARKRRPATRAAAPKKRSRGRPRAAQGTVGRDAIVAAARRLVEKLPPHKVTIVEIARNAGVDPALVRYYFSNREHLLIAVIEQILGDWAPHPAPDATPEQQLTAHLSGMLEFSFRVRSMQRLMIEECAEAKSAEVRARVRELNAAAVRYFARLLRLKGDGTTETLEPLFLHVAIIGLCEFFAAAQSMILPLAPKGMSAKELAARYERFIRELVLDGFRPRLAAT